MSLFTKLFGGDRSKDRSWNNAYPQLSESLSGTVGKTGQVSDALAALLGIGGDPTAQNAAFDNFRNSTGYNFLMDSGISAIKGGNASQGLFNSGATGQRLMQFGQDLASTTYDKYVNQLLGLGGMALNAAGTLADAGRESLGTASKDSGGLGKLIGSIFASERRLKQNIEKLGELEDGLGIYSYEYKDNPGTMFIGTMVEEVETLRPWALGPVTEEGNRTVDYSKLNKETF